MLTSYHGDLDTDQRVQVTIQTVAGRSCQLVQLEHFGRTNRKDETICLKAAGYRLCIVISRECEAEIIARMLSAGIKYKVAWKREPRIRALGGDPVG